MEDGRINEEYFSVLAAKGGPYIKNAPTTFPEDHADDRIKRCCNTQAIAQDVHGTTSLDLKDVKAYVGQKEKVLSVLPTIGFMNVPGPPGDCGSSIVGKGAVILTEDRMILFCANSSKQASASDFITGTTYCTYLCLCFPCCYGFCGCIEGCRLSNFTYKQVAFRENEDFQDSVTVSNAKVSIKNSSTTQLIREYTAGATPSEGCCKPFCDLCYKCCTCCSDVCKPFFYHGTHNFSYEDDGSKMGDVTIEALTTKTVGHDDMAWGVMDELSLVSLLTDPKTKELFAQNPDSPECRALLLKKFGSKFSPEQCLMKVQNMTKGLKTKDLCTSKSVKTVNITHWDPASQKIRTTVCVCDPDQVQPQDLMKFQVDASAPKNSMESVAPAAEISLPASSLFGASVGGGMLNALCKRFC